MRFAVVIVITLFFAAAVQAQSLFFDLSLGAGQYQGDLTDKIFMAANTKAVGGIGVHYGRGRHWALRSHVVITKLVGSDAVASRRSLQARNLSFSTTLSELSVAAEYATFNLDERRLTPYIFGGIAVFHFNPYTFTTTGAKVYLKPLGTEGQGIAGYAAKPYAATQLAIPFGGGLRYALTDNIRLGLELGFRRLFTDHLDDVSTNYADAGELLAARGPLAVALAYRGDELPNSNPTYPEKGAQRGGATQNDYYYHTVFTIGFRLGKNRFGATSGRTRKGYGCPVSPL